MLFTANEDPKMSTFYIPVSTAFEPLSAHRQYMIGSCTPSLLWKPLSLMAAALFRLGIVFPATDKMLQGCFAECVQWENNPFVLAGAHDIMPDRCVCLA